MCDDERIEECKGCNEESCVCEDICDTCNGWKSKCSCVTEPVLAYWCNECQETVEAELEVKTVNGEQVVYPICACGSDNLIRVDDIVDAAEYSKGDR